MWNDTVTPRRIRNAIQGVWLRILNSEKGEVAGEGGEGSGEGEQQSQQQTQQSSQQTQQTQQTQQSSGRWTDTLPDNIKGHPIFQKYPSQNEALTAFVEVQKLIGPEKIIMPSKDADEKEWNERVFDRLGRPKTPAEYKLPVDFKLPEGFPVEEKLVTGFKEQAHKLGILPKQFEGMYKWFMNEQVTRHNNISTEGKNQIEKATNELRTEWGSAFDQNLALGEKVLNSFADDKTISFLKNSGLNRDSSFIKFLSKVGKSFSEDQLSGKPQQLTMSPEEAQAEIRKMEMDSNNPIHNAGHIEHKAALSKRDMLYKMAYPNG